MLIELSSELLLTAAMGAIPALTAVCGFIYVRDFKRIEAEFSELKKTSESQKDKISALENKVDRLECAMRRRAEQISIIKGMLRGIPNYSLPRGTDDSSIRPN